MTGPLAAGLCLIFLAAAALIAHPQMGGSSEAREAHVMQSVVAGDWILPHRNNVLPSKPPLHHWIGAACAALAGGVSELTARLPSLLSAIFSLIVVAFASSSFEPRNGSRPIMWLALCITSSSYGFLSLALDARVDMTFSAFVTAANAIVLGRLALVAFDGVALARAVRERDIVLFLLCCGLATLAKGPLGVVLPVLFGLALTASLVPASELLRFVLRPRASVLIYPLIVCPWYALAFSYGGEGFLARQLGFENFERFVGGEDVNVEPWWFYGPSFLRVFFPWSVLFLMCAARDVWSAGLRRSAIPHARGEMIPRIRLGLLCGIAVLFVFLSAASGKRHSYLLPILPLCALYLGSALPALTYRFLNESKRSVYAFRALYACACILLVIATALFFLFLPLGVLWSPQALGAALAHLLGPPTEGQELTLTIALHFLERARFAALFALAVIGACAFMASRALARQRPGAASWCALGVVLLYVVAIVLGQGVKYEFKDFRGQASLMRTAIAQGEKPILLKESHDELFDPLLFYYKSHVEIRDRSALEQSCRDGNPILARSEVMREFRLRGFAGESVLVLLQPLDRLAGKSDRAIELARCFHTTRPAAGSP